MFEQNGDDKSTFVVPLKMTPPTQASLLKMTPPTQAIEAMGGHDDSGLSEKISIGVANDVPTFNAENMQNNMKAVYYSRTFMCIIGGVVAGILGFTGLTGFIFYFLVMAITSVGLVAKICLRLRAHILRGYLLHPAWNRRDDAVTASCCDGFDKLK
ncbi:hypothetical protein HYC85_006244 [Camellia sinensis]|uniref:ER membrane protein complex subunit 6 n=1 Tax=Camellia sinensis TaxID=4442 RepID=A0A7J7HN05_CAMSI|nr:hypothetical protein HYC85_006244 [Camellia sinensis]